MPPAFNLSQDQTLQFNLCLLALLPKSFYRLRSLKILTRSISCEMALLSFCEHLIFVKCFNPSGLSNLHQTPTLIICLLFKDPHPSQSHPSTSRHQQSVVFVSSRETRLCSNFSLPSRTFLTDLLAKTLDFSSLLTSFRMRETNYSKHS